MVQTGMAAEALRRAGADVSIVEITTKGDADARSLWEMGGQGVFTAAIEEAMLDGRCDAAVHSAKDLPTRLADGLVLAAALPRGDVRDALVAREGKRLADLDAGAVVGTSSVRRAAALLALKGDLKPTAIRGNVPTRIEKVMNGEYAAAVLAVAGLARLGLENVATEVFESDIMLPAAGQGAIVVEIREGDAEAAALCEAINDTAALAAVRAERAVVRALGAGCRAAVGALARPDGAGFLLKAEVLTADGKKSWRAEARFHLGGEEEVGAQAAEKLRAAGARVGRE
jgi:hydroxymethylbilane synthase